MNIAAWAILGVIVLSVVMAIAEGFFHQAFGLAGLVVGYLLAAWQYRRLAEWFAPQLKAPWLGEIVAFVAVFFGGGGGGGGAGRGLPLGGKEERAWRFGGEPGGVCGRPDR